MLRITPKNRRKISSPVRPIICFKYFETNISSIVSPRILIIAAITANIPALFVPCENNNIDNVKVPGPAKRGIDIGKTEISSDAPVLPNFNSCVIIINAV